MWHNFTRISVEPQVEFILDSEVPRAALYAIKLVLKHLSGSIRTAIRLGVSKLGLFSVPILFSLIIRTKLTRFPLKNFFHLSQ